MNASDSRPARAMTRAASLEKEVGRGHAMPDCTNTSMPCAEWKHHVEERPSISTIGGAERARAAHPDNEKTATIASTQRVTIAKRLRHTIRLESRAGGLLAGISRDVTVLTAIVRMNSRSRVRLTARSR